MKQVVQNYRTGKLFLEQVPTPVCKDGCVLVRNESSVVSSGTERMKVTQARMSLLQKAKARPDKVAQVLTTLKQTGIRETYNKVTERLDALTPLGYSCCGTVVEVGAGIDSIKVGDRVACAGEGIACHAEYVCVPRNLCAAVPDDVDTRDAAFTTIGAIAMNGVRQSEVALGDTVLVIGLGLVGLLGVQLLAANGCRVIGVDLDSAKLALALDCGAEAAFLSSDPSLEKAVLEATSGRGVDVVYIAASTSSTAPMDLAGEVARDRAKVVVVGMIPVQADWQTYYGKELDIVMARSYGPGRYDRGYEEKGIDYPAGYVPWTIRRNLEEFLRLLSIKAVKPAVFGSQVYPFEEAEQAYKQVHDNPSQHAVGIIFDYADAGEKQRTVAIQGAHKAAVQGSVNIAMVGAGNFATGTLIPALKKVKQANLHTICSARGLTAASAGKRHGFQYAASDFDELVENPDIDGLVIATRHDTHAEMTIKGLQHNKHVFVEKPLALSLEDLLAIRDAEQNSKSILLPGFNRRFSPLSHSVQQFFSPDAGPLEVVCRVNAGQIEADSWYQDSAEGGWRIVSEGCHFVDLISYITQSHPTRVHAVVVGGKAEGQQNDNCLVTLEMENGSIATLAYLANGDSAYEKERIEVFGQGRTACIRNWRDVVLSSGGKSKNVSPGSTGKGHGAEIQSYIDGIRDGKSPIDAESAILTTLATLKILESLQDGMPKEIKLG